MNPLINWLDIPGYEGHYQVSNAGQVYSLKSSLIMKQSMITGGYYAVCLSLNNRQKMYTIHSLVALAFIGERPPDCYIHHKNETKTDNRVENLEYKLASEHTRGHTLGKRPPNTKLTTAQVVQIRELYRSGKLSRVELAQKFNENGGLGARFPRL